MSRRVRVAACVLAFLGGAVPGFATSSSSVTAPAPAADPATRIFTLAYTVTVIGERSNARTTRGIRITLDGFWAGTGRTTPTPTAWTLIRCWTRRRA